MFQLSLLYANQFRLLIPPGAGLTALKGFAITHKNWKNSEIVLEPLLGLMLT